MIKRQISFLFEDPGFCIDVFCTIAEPVRYYNRDTESGAWYSSTPDWNENGSLIREDLIFEVIANGVVCALDGNGNFEGKKPFVPFSENLLNKMDIIEGESDVSVLKEKLWNGNNVILVSHYNDKGELSGGADNTYYFGLSLGDTIQFYENGVPTEAFTVIAKAAVTSNEMALTGGGSNIATDIGGPKIYMSENKFKEIYETPTLYGFLFDVEEQYQQDMENYLMRDTDVSYNSISTLKADVLGIKNVVLLVGGMIGAVFALVGLINFINLVMTNIVTRRHEFATMQSIGMTNRQLRKMMISESFSYVLLAGIVGTLVAATLGMTLLRAFVENGPTSMMMTFQITLLPALIMLVLFLVLAFIVPVVALRLLNNRSVVEQLRVNE